MDIKKKINLTRNDNLRLQYKLKQYEKDIKERDDLISEIASKLDNNQPIFNNYIHGRNALKNKPNLTVGSSNSINNSELKSLSNTNSLSFDQKQSILVFNLKSQ